MRFLRYGILGLSLLLVTMGLTRIYFDLTDDFRLANITYQLPFIHSWKTETLAHEDNTQLDQILNQKFTYIGKGAQCYAFGSEDGKFVLKFFKFKHLKPSWMAFFLPPSQYKEQYFLRKEQKLRNVFDAYDLAYREDKENVALIYLHLTPVDHFQKKAIVFDKVGIKREIDLNTTVFLIQKKGETLRSRLNQLLSQKDLDGSKESIDKILQMYISEYKKGIYDRDHGVMVNVGFVGENPFHLDAGKFAKIERMKEREIYSEDLELVIWKIEEWLSKNFPEYQNELFAYMENRFHAYTGGRYERSKINMDLFKARRHSAILNP
jgi:hypothetical protein